MTDLSKILRDAARERSGSHETPSIVFTDEHGEPLPPFRRWLEDWQRRGRPGAVGSLVFVPDNGREGDVSQLVPPRFR